VSQHVWQDEDLSMLKGPEHKPRFCSLHTSEKVQERDVKKLKEKINRSFNFFLGKDLVDVLVGVPNHQKGNFNFLK
jgi:hypothetical protein